MVTHANVRDVEIERIIEAPRELVFRLWSKPEYLLRWFSPHRCTLVIHRFEFRVGGEFRSTIRGPDGSGCEAVATFLEIVPSEKIVYGIRAKGPEGWPEETTVTVSFADHARGMLLRLRQNAPEELAKRTGAYPSWLEMFDRMGAEATRSDGGSSSLELFYHPLASYCHKVLIGLYENDTAFVPRQVDLINAESSADFFALWPVGKMPILRDGNTGKVVPESSLVLEYLDGRYPGRTPLWPRASEELLEARLWDRFFDHYVQTPMQKIVGDRLRAEHERDPRGVTDARESLHTAYGVLEERMRDRTWVLGENFSAADCAAAPALFYAGIVEPFGPSRRHLADYFERLVARPSFARVLVEARPYFVNFPYKEALPSRFQ